jgi:hypothetical protein
MIKIDRNVQIPEARSNYPFEDMGCGDSILFIEERRAASARVAAVRFAKRHRPDWVFTLRRVDDGWRLWRVG